MQDSNVSCGVELTVLPKLKVEKAVFRADQTWRRNHDCRKVKLEELCGAFSSTTEKNSPIPPWDVCLAERVRRVPG